MLSVVWDDPQQVLPAIADMLAAESQLIVLVKPQFEAGKSQACSMLPPQVLWLSHRPFPKSVLNY